MKKRKLTGGAGWSLGPASDAPAPAAPKPAASRPFMRLEKRAKGKAVTVIGGYGLPPDAWVDLARALKSACGVGGTATADGLELQGDCRDRARALLAARGMWSHG